MTEWNAAAYTRLSNPLQSFGETILAQLPLSGDETVLDLGCGTGRLAELMLRRLPRGRLIVVDRSANMLAAARELLEPVFGERVEFLQRSVDALGLHEVADLAFSNAVFHWIRDHPRLFRSVYAALRPGGWLVAQCGASPNIARIRDRLRRLMDSPTFRPYFEGWSGPWEFASPEVTAQRLRSAEFEAIETSMFEAPVQLASIQQTRDYFQNVILGSHLERIPDAALRAEFAESLTLQSAADEPPFSQDYWRLNIRARRPSWSS